MSQLQTLCHPYMCLWTWIAQSTSKCSALYTVEAHSTFLTSKVWLFPSSCSIFPSGLLRECSLSNYLLILITCLMSNVSIYFVSNLSSLLKVKGLWVSLRGRRVSSVGTLPIRKCLICVLWCESCGHHFGLECYVIERYVFLPIITKLKYCGWPD